MKNLEQQSKHFAHLAPKIQILNLDLLPLQYKILKKTSIITWTILLCIN